MVWGFPRNKTVYWSPPPSVCPHLPPRLVISNNKEVGVGSLVTMSPRAQPMSPAHEPSPGFILYRCEGVSYIPEETYDVNSVSLAAILCVCKQRPVKSLPASVMHVVPVVSEGSWHFKGTGPDLACTARCLTS